MKLFQTYFVVCSMALSAPALFAQDAMSPPMGGPAAACKQDVQTLCPNVQPGGGRIIACLKSHAPQVSQGCKEAIKAGHERRRQQGPDSAQPGSAPPTTAPPASVPPN